MAGKVEILGTPTAATTILLDGELAKVTVGATSLAGDVYVYGGQTEASVHISGKDAKLTIGTIDNDGDLDLIDKKGNKAIHLGGENARAVIGATGNDGDLYLRDGSDLDEIHLGAKNARLTLGAKPDGRTSGPGGEIILREAARGRRRWSTAPSPSWTRSSSCWDTTSTST